MYFLSDIIDKNNDFIKLKSHVLEVTDWDGKLK